MEIEGFASRGELTVKRILKSKRGISPILATLLLIVIAVAAVIVTYAWVMTFTTTQTEQAGAVLSEANTRFYNVTSTFNIEVTIMNSGSADAKIAKVYFGTSSGSLQELTSGVNFDPVSKIVSANGGSLKITMTQAWVPGTRYYFNFITEAGQQMPINHVAPAYSS
jgi:flagellin-like protein